MVIGSPLSGAFGESGTRTARRTESAPGGNAMAVSRAGTPPARVSDTATALISDAEYVAGRSGVSSLMATRAKLRTPAPVGSRPQPVAVASNTAATIRCVRDRRNRV